jgi:hypothetical protein
MAIKSFEENQKRENYMWQTYGETIKNILTNSNPRAKIEKIEGMLDSYCGIDAVINNPSKYNSWIKFLSLRILNNNYKTFTFRIPTSGSEIELSKLFKSYNPTPHYHIQITEGSKGTQISMLNIERLAMYVDENPSFWQVIKQYIKKGDRNNYYSIPIAKFKRFIKIIELEN